jgi:hypothetical protein
MSLRSAARAISWRGFLEGLNFQSVPRQFSSTTSQVRHTAEELLLPGFSRLLLGEIRHHTCSADLIHTHVASLGHSIDADVYCTVRNSDSPSAWIHFSVACRSPCASFAVHVGGAGGAILVCPCRQKPLICSRCADPVIITRMNLQ